MNRQLTAAVIILLIFLLLVIITQVLYSFLKLESGKSRKFLHVTGGLLALSAPSFISSHWYVLAICALALILLTVTFYKKLLPSIHQTKRVSVGSIIFPIPVYICFLVAEKMDGNMLYYYLPVSLLTISDTIAEIGGNRWGHLSASLFDKQKTIIGSTCFAISAFILSLIFVVFIFQIDSTRSVMIIISITVVSTIAELLSFKGYDNLSVPLSALIVLRLFIP